LKSGHEKERRVKTKYILKGKGSSPKVSRNPGNAFHGVVQNMADVRGDEKE